MANYLKEYEVLGQHYGIEDFKSRGEHFFNGKDTNGRPLPRFMLWAGGCGIGYASSLDEANSKLYTYIWEDVSHELDLAKDRFNGCERVLSLLDTSLAPFKIRKENKK